MSRAVWYTNIDNFGLGPARIQSPKMSRAVWYTNINNFGLGPALQSFGPGLELNATQELIPVKQSGVPILMVEIGPGPASFRWVGFCKPGAWMISRVKLTSKTQNIFQLEANAIDFIYCQFSSSFMESSTVRYYYLRLLFPTQDDQVGLVWHAT